MPLIQIPKDSSFFPPIFKPKEPKKIPTTPSAAWRLMVKEQRQEFPKLLARLERRPTEAAKVRRMLPTQQRKVAHLLTQVSELPRGPVKAATMALSLAAAGFFLGALDGALTFNVAQPPGPGPLRQTRSSSLVGGIERAFQVTREKTLALIQEERRSGTTGLEEKVAKALDGLGQGADDARQLSSQAAAPPTLAAFKQHLGGMLFGGYAAGLMDAAVFALKR